MVFSDQIELRNQVKPENDTMQAQTVLHKLIKHTCSAMPKVRRRSVEANVLAALNG